MSLYKVQIKKAKFCIIFIKFSIFFLFWDRIEATKKAVNIIETWNIKSKSIERPKTDISSKFS